MNPSEFIRKNPNVQIVYEGVKKKGEKTVYDKDGNPVPAIVFGVEKKLPLDKLKRSEILPRAVDSKPTDVVEVGRIYANPPLKKSAKEPQQERLRPIKAGISIGHVNITAGTLGAVVLGTREAKKSSLSKLGLFSRFLNWLRNLFKTPTPPPEPEDPPENTGDVFIVSNAHVVNNENQGKKGDTVIQPGDYDGGVSPEDAIATVHEAVKLNPDGVNYVDVALAKVNKNVGYKLGQYGDLPIKSPLLDAQIGTKVCKTGRTTFYTEGKITGRNAASRIWYDCGVLLFEGQIVIESDNPYPFSDGGDSGSLIMDMDGRPVALLFAGSDVITLANPIGLVMDSLETKFTFG